MTLSVVEFIPEHRENVTENISHDEGNDNQADRASQVKRHDHERIIEGMHPINKIHPRLRPTEGNGETPNEMDKRDKRTKNQSRFIFIHKSLINAVNVRPLFILYHFYSNSVVAGGLFINRQRSKKAIKDVMARTQNNVSL